MLAESARIQEAHLFLAFGEYARAFERAEEAERFRLTIGGSSLVTDIPLWRGLAAAKCCVPTLAQEQRAPLLATLEHAIQRFRYFSEGCAENFLHKLRLLQAEHARLHGKTDDAMAKYDEAITLARQERCLYIEALAAQFCAEFHLAADRQRLASLYLHEARDAYTRWDAFALVTFLEQTRGEGCRSKQRTWTIQSIGHLLTDLQQRAEETLQTFPRDVRDATTTVAAELVSNATKHGASVQHPSGKRLIVQLQAPPSEAPMTKNQGGSPGSPYRPSLCLPISPPTDNEARGLPHDRRGSF